MGRTRVVRWLRVLTPLAALAILSMLFLLARQPGTEPAIPYAQGRLEELARTPGVGAPEFATVTPSGATVTLRARDAAPHGGATEAQALALDWLDRDGLRMSLTAQRGRLEGPRLTLDGDVALRLSSGWTLDAPRIEADTAADLLAAPRSVAVTAPFGTLSAGAMRLARGPSGARVLELNGGVRLLYRP